MKTVLNRYSLLIDEINPLCQRIAKEEPKKAQDDFIDFLIDAYAEGFAGVGYMLGEVQDLDTERLSAALNKSYDGVSIYDKLAEYVRTSDVTALQTLLDSEFHRMYNVGGLDNALQSKKSVYKAWVTVGDEKVRDTHRYLEGVRVPLGDDFVTYDGDTAPAPGLFSKAENNVNCRCVLQYDIE